MTFQDSSFLSDRSGELWEDLSDDFVAEPSMVEKIRQEMAQLFDSRCTTAELAERLYVKHEKERAVFVERFNRVASHLIVPTFEAFERRVSGLGLRCHVHVQEGVYIGHRRITGFVRFGLGAQSLRGRHSTGAVGHFVDVLADTTARHVVVSHAGPSAALVAAQGAALSVELGDVDVGFLHSHLSALVKPFFG
ncbi:hypothetical protein [Variovorax ginsengisoli]|uniref:Uncharacterized protein n=1 Tax=Variovorax ginsengisoli TaxID=363844 RepID=A0ABT9SA84_9BURK|nr:hypothetical protein [Variovorax ginsengisoli]MDP9901271.1 hypothetical protein [Variovorax ginsengisoli]